MTSKTKSATRKKLSTSGNASPKNFSFRRSDIALVPLGLLAVYCAYFFLEHAGAIPRIIQDPWSIPFSLPSVALIIAAFGAFYIYRDVTRKEVGRYSRGVAYFLAILVVWCGATVLATSTSTEASANCTGLMGA